MWVLKFRVKNTDSIYTLLSQKYQIKDSFYPVDSYRRGKSIYILGIHLIEGQESEKKKFLEELRKHKKTERFELHGDMLILLMKEEEKFYDLIYAPSFYHPAPAVVQDGYEYWRIASWNRAALEKLWAELKKWKKIFPVLEMHKLGMMKPQEIYFPKVIPVLPVQQDKAFRIAVLNGYYAYPRKNDLRALAKIQGVSLSTYQEHLRKAEAKLLPFFAGKVRGFGK